MKLRDIVENQHLLKVPEYPKDVMLKGGFYMVRGSTHDRNVTWFVHRLMEDEEEATYAVARMNVGEAKWTYVPLKPSTGPEMTQFPKSSDFFKLDKFKEWVIECLQHERLL